LCSRRRVLRLVVRRVTKGFGGGQSAMTRRLKVLIVDDHRLMLDALRVTLERDEDMSVVGEADSGEKVLPLVAQTGPDVVLLDVRMPGLDGLAVLAQIRERYPRVAVVMLSALDDPVLIRAALERGAAAFVLKLIDPRDLAAAVRQAVAGSIFRPLDPVGTPGQDVREELGLSKRELSILEALQSGGSNQEIAKQLFLAEQTVKFHLTNIYRKLGVSTRTEAIHFAYANSLVERPFAYVA
jgi:DNA-binding NarL/FixJ family response regulator